MQVASLGGLSVIVAQPGQGLGKITADAAKEFAKVLAAYEQQGATMLIEFAHEMNGNWYVWGQQPMEYISAFQTMSTAIKKVSPDLPSLPFPLGPCTPRLHDSRRQEHNVTVMIDTVC